MSLQTAIGDYDLLHPLGGGPLTQVFAARRRIDQFPCAIKIAREQWPTASDAIRSLAREAEALESVRHLNVVRLIDQQVKSEPRFLALELLSGESLRDRIQREGKSDQRMALWFARQIAEGLQAIHQAGFIHGDVKPGNVQVELSGRAVLFDLGFARRPKRIGAMGAECHWFGTPNYVAPELAEPPHVAHFAADWFSFGVMLHEMLEVHASRRLTELTSGLVDRNPAARPNASFVIHELIALEIAAFLHRRAG